MSKILRKVYTLYVLLDLVVMGICFYGSYFYYIIIQGYSVIPLTVKNAPNFKEYSFVFILWAILLYISLKKKDLYYTDRNLSIPKEIFLVFASILYTVIFIGAAIFFAQYKFFSRQVFFISFLLLSISLSGWRTAKRLILRKLIAEGFHNINILIIGAGRMGRMILEEIKKNPCWGFNVVGFLDDIKENNIDNIPVLGKLSNFIDIVKKHFVDEVIVTVPSEKKAVSDLMIQAKRLSLGLKVVPEDFGEALPILDIIHMGITPLLTYKERRPHPAEFALKRIFDIFVSLILLILLSPLFLFMAILIKLDSSGPVLYIQKRTGHKGRVFNFYKFRSMVKEADRLKATLTDKNESIGGIIFKIRSDPRVTRIGRFFRKYSLDELSQLINVLKGEMSLVGPRPFPVEESSRFESNHMERLTVRPGITGLAQIKGRSDLSFHRWVKWDLWYVNNWSFWLDLMILWRTIPTALKGKGAY